MRKRAGAKEREGGVSHFLPATTPSSGRARLIFARAWYRLCFGNRPAYCWGQPDSLWVSYQLSGSSVFSQSERLPRP